MLHYQAPVRQVRAQVSALRATRQKQGGFWDEAIRSVQRLSRSAEGSPVGFLQPVGCTQPWGPC